MSDESVLNDKDQELIAIAASIAAGCVPCANFHFRAARIAGASQDEIRRTVDLALSVRQSATLIMGRLDRGRTDGADIEEAVRGSASWPLSELVLISAAYALNCAASLEKHIQEALSNGATGGQILTALKISCAVKSMAGRKIQETAARALVHGGQVPDACNCDEQALQPARGASAANRTEPERSCGEDCSCHD